MKEILIQEYNNTKKLSIPYKEPQNTISYNFVDGATFEVNGNISKKYKVKFFNSSNGELVHESTITNNMWSKTSVKYFIPWRIEVYDDETNELLDTHILNLKDKKVYIHLDSSALGDTISWFPYLEEFRKKHNCHLVVSTYKNKWFKNTYPTLEFTEPGEVVYDIFAKYGMGWYYNGKEINNDLHPINPQTIPLQQAASSILGLPYREIKPLLDIPEKPQAIEGDYICIAPHASALAKYWNYPGGWQTVVDYLNEKGFKVVMITHEAWGDDWHDSKLGGKLQNIIDRTGNYPIEDIYNDIKHAKAFIGVSSGLSWLTFTTNTPAIMISGFSKPFTEFQDCIRVFDYTPNLCTGCFNKHWLDPGDWEWCPNHKGTPRQFECTKHIEPKQVIFALNKTLNIY